MSSLFQCAKKKYGSWQHAANDARALRRKTELPERPYRCRKCQAWHVGADYIIRTRKSDLKRHG